jgi:hypothetical protein
MNGYMIMTLKEAALCLRRTGIRAVVVGVLTVALSAGVVACTHPKLPTPPVGLADCYEGLPLAEGALNAPRGSYQFHGVKLVAPPVVERMVHHRFPKNPSSVPAVPAGTRVCAFAFTGNFPAGQVAFAPQNVSGKAAIVLVTTKEKLLFSFVLAKLPENFGRTFTGDLRAP